MHKYKKVSLQIRQIFMTYTPIVEPLSLDEAFLDVTGSTDLFRAVDAIALMIKQRIQQELNLTASVGVACNKFLAKLASVYDHFSRQPDTRLNVDNPGS